MLIYYNYTQVVFPPNNFISKDKLLELEALLPKKEEPMIPDDCEEVR